MVSDLKPGYIQHPCSIPAQISLCEAPYTESHQKDASIHTGISLVTDTFFATGTELEVEISIHQPGFKATGKVAWCLPIEDGLFRTGICFNDADTAYKVRMVEQLCYIEQYRRTVEREEGRKLNQEDAAREWITYFAKDFPALNTV